MKDGRRPLEDNSTTHNGLFIKFFAVIHGELLVIAPATYLHSEDSGPLVSEVVDTCLSVEVPLDD